MLSVLSLTLALSTPVPRTTPPEVALTDSYGREVILRGVNVGLKHPPYLPAVTADDFRLLRSWGLNSVRLLTLWAALEPEEGRWDEEYIEGLRDILDLADQEGIQVILDMHQDVYGEGFGFDGAPRWTCAEALYEHFEPFTGAWWLNYLKPEVSACFDRLWYEGQPLDHLVETWAHLAEEVGQHPAVVGFDLFNEPWGGFRFGPHFEREGLQPFYEELIPRLREAAPESWIFFEPNVLHNMGYPTSLTPLPFDRTVFAPHFYWIPMEISGTYEGNQGAMEAYLNHCAREATDLDTPLWVGEYGGNTNSPDFTAWLLDTGDILDDLHASGAYWEFGQDGCDSYSVMGCDGLPKPQVEVALARPYPQATQGEIVFFRWDTEAGLFRMQWQGNPTIVAPTEISLPDPYFGGGAEVVITPDSPWYMDEQRHVVVIGPNPREGLYEVEIRVTTPIDKPTHQPHH